jgi:hypothetical protein
VQCVKEKTLVLDCLKAQQADQAVDCREVILAFSSCSKKATKVIRRNLRRNLRRTVTE